MSEYAQKTCLKSVRSHHIISSISNLLCDQFVAGAHAGTNMCQLFCDQSTTLCSSLPAIDVPDAVETIGDRCFEECVSLSRVVLATGSVLNSMGASAFLNCKNLQVIEIHPSVGDVLSL